MEPMLKKKSMFNRVFKRQFFVTICTIFLLVFILIGSSYALLNAKTETGLTDVVVQSGNLIATISSDSEIIQMDYTTLGVSDEVGLSYDPYTFTISNNGENKIAYYEIRIVDKEYEISTLPHKSLNYALSVNGSDYTNPQNLGDNRSYIYVGGSLDVGESDTFSLKLWVNEEFGKYANNKILRASIELTLYSDIPTRNYIIYDSQGGSYIPKTNVVSKRISMQKPVKAGYSFIGWSSTPDGEVEYESNAIYNGTNGMTLYAKYEEATITYNLNGGTGEIPSNKASQGITTIVPTKEGYIFKGWSTTENGEVVYQSGVSYSGSSIILYAVWYIPPMLYDTLETSLVSNLTQPDSNDTRYVFGSDIDNNYVWYSGKLWRVVSLNGNRSTQLITQGNMTAIAWDPNNSNNYSTSQVRIWLNNDFLHTLYNRDNIVINGNFDYEYGITNDKVGLLTLNQYYTSGGVSFVESFEKDGNTYLNNGLSCFLITPYTKDNNTTKVWQIRSNSAYDRATAQNHSGVRPSVNLKSDIRILGGEGTSDNPYRLEGDIENGENNELLNTRISGEYIKFNDTLYRIVGTEIINNQTLIKVTMADYKKNSNTINKSMKFGDNITFSKSTGIGLYLNDWYESLTNSYKRMIATENDGILWYQGPENGVQYDYTKSKLGTGISSPIGLPYYGEMFSSQFNLNNYENVMSWMMTKYSNSYIMYIDETGAVSYYVATQLRGVRPSFYLKSTVKIGDADGDGKVGTGLPNDPYEIVMD